MSNPAATLGSSGGIGSGTGAGYQSEARSGIGEFLQKIANQSGSGNRGTMNIVSFEGSSQSTDAGINEPVSKPKYWIALVVVGFIAVIYFFKK